MITKPKLRKISGEWTIKAHRVRTTRPGFQAAEIQFAPEIETAHLTWGPFLSWELAAQCIDKIVWAFGPVFHDGKVQP